MESEKKKNKIKVVIIILSVLLAFSLLSLAGTLICNHINKPQPTFVVVPDNIIAPEDDGSTSGAEDASGSDNSESSGENTDMDSLSDTGFGSVTGSKTAAAETSDEDISATAISLHKRKPDDNTPFQVINMFPGDNETKYYSVRVSHKGDVILRFHADVRPGYEKLAEVMKCRIILPESGEVMYDGLMRDMPKSLNHELITQQSTTSQVYYQITAYLETSVGNEYMDKDLIADFRWWVEEMGNLELPQTGDTFNLYLWICLVSTSLFVLIMLWRKRSKEEQTDEQ